MPEITGLVLGFLFQWISKISEIYSDLCDLHKLLYIFLSEIYISQNSLCGKRTVCERIVKS